MAIQNRKQIMDAAGNWVPVADEPQVSQAPDAGISARQFHIGEAVHLAGRVLEVQHPQGGQTSVKVQLPQGAVWLRSHHLTHSEPLEEPVEEIVDPEADPDVEPEAEAVEKALSAPPEDKAVKSPAESK